jgi:CubicO group peptidase (beta-lactamase class C family)
MFLSLYLGGNQRAVAAVPSGLDDFVRQRMNEYNVPGVAVAIVEGDSVTVRGYGVRSAGKPGAVDGDTVFMIASNTKPFTAALAGIMVDAGKIGWDDHIVDRYPTFALRDMYASRMCTMRDLLAHRSGLPAFYGDILEVLGFTREEIMV